MKRAFVFSALIIGVVAGFYLVASAQVEFTVIGQGTGMATMKNMYYAIGGSNPYHETKLQDNVTAIGPYGIAASGSFAGAFTYQNQFEVVDGVLKFKTTAQYGKLTITTEKDANDNERQVGVLDQAASGSSGTLGVGYVANKISTAGGLAFGSEVGAINFSVIKFGAVQVVDRGYALVPAAAQEGAQAAETETGVSRIFTFGVHSAFWGGAPFEGQFSVKFTQ
jgi:hypothetical protein